MTSNKGENMDLRTYLFVNKIKTKDFAKEMGKSSNFMYRISNKQVRPSVALAKAIEIKTGGKVKAKDMLREAFEEYLNKVFKNGLEEIHKPDKKRKK